MDMTGEYRIPASRQVVWEALNDPDVLKQAIPGCEEIEKDSPTSFTAKVTAKLGPVKARFTGAVTLTDLNPPESYTITGEGKGGPAGFAKGGAKVHLLEEGAETVLTYEVNAAVGGKIAQLGGRLIDSTARKMADQFFSKFVEIVTAGNVPGQPAAVAAAPPAAPTPASAPVEATPTAAPVETAAPPVPEPSAPEDGEAEAERERDGDDDVSPVVSALQHKMAEARTEEKVSVSNPYVWVGAVIGLVIVLLLLWAFGAF
ncbi:MAG: carbon monoxide dehydrogenase subunit G [Alphaproteobacteria bacterium]